jgi:hypothetical protein
MAIHQISRIIFFQLFAFLLAVPIVQAVSPPSMPLPECTEVDGSQEGACPSEDEALSGSASGSFSAGGSVLITTNPEDGICVGHNGYPPYDWSPSPCFSKVYAPVVAGCGYIDLQNEGRFRETSCSRALYLDPQNQSALFTLTSKDGSTGCGGAGDFNTYFYGGPANVEGARWSERGGDTLDCNIKFEGERPDGLYGPTWVKVRVAIEQAEDGDERRGYKRPSTEFYVPIDGDMRELLDVEVLATGEVTKEGDVYLVSTTAAVTNNSTESVDNFTLIATFPDQVHVTSVSHNKCNLPPDFVGGTVRCVLSLDEKGDAFGNDVTFIDIEARIINVADLDNGTGEAVFKLTVPGDQNSTNDDDIYRFPVSPDAGTVADTIAEMEVLKPYFDYEISSESLLGQQCNIFMDDIFQQLEKLREEQPALFTNLSYGLITSGSYSVITKESLATEGAGHVGVVVYKKGTDYHETGVIIHGTPTTSPVDLDLESRMGILPAGDHVTGLGFSAELTVWGGTDGHGQYYRTPIRNFPGSPRPEGPEGCGYEGMYVDNREEFAQNRVGTLPTCQSLPAKSSASTKSCPTPPNTSIIITESPVNISVNNANGQVLKTEKGKLTFDESLDGGVFAWETRHDDGSYGWFIALPKDGYDVKLTGTDEGAYTLKLVTFDDSEKPEIFTQQGMTEDGQIEDFEVLGGVTANNTGSSGGGGGGAFNAWLLVFLLTISLWGRRFYRFIR